ncbi:MAG: T9SS type A sorting domain-containing protein [Bacteroidota bacterium]
MGIYVLSGTLSSINISTAGEIQTANTSANPLPSGKSWGSASIVTYNAPSGGQTVAAGIYTHLQASNTSGTQTANGNITVDQIFIIAASATLNMATYTLSGNITSPQVNGTISTTNTGSTPLPSGKIWGGTIIYNATSGSQTIVNGTYTNLTISSTSGTSNASGQVTVTNDFNVATGTTLDMGSNLLWGPMNGTITLNGTVKTIHNDGIPNGRTWGGTGTVHYALTTGGTVSTGTYYNLISGNTSGTNSVSGNITVNGTLTTTAGGTLDMVTYTLGGTLSGINNSGTLKLASISSTPIPAGKTWGGTVEYYASATQTVSGGTYNNLTLTNGTKNAVGDLVVNGTLIKDNLNLDMGIYVLSGTLAGLSNNNGIITTANTSANPLPAGKHWGTASWMVYNAPTGGQTIVGATATHLNLQNTSGTQTVSGDLSIDQRFIIVAGSTLSMGTYQLSGQITSIEVSGTLTTANTSATPIPANRNWSYATTTTIIYNAPTGGQTIMSGTYRNLTMGNTSGTQTPSGSLTVDSTLTTTAGGTLNLGTNTLSGTLGTIMNNGTLATTNNATFTPIPSGKTWGGTIKYQASAGGQSIVQGNYTNLTVSTSNGSQTVRGTIDIAGTLTISSTTTLVMGTHVMTGASASISISSSGSITTTNTSAAPLPSGKTWGGTVQYNATTGGQTIASGTYNNLTLGNTSGTQTAGGDLVVNGTLNKDNITLDMGIYVLSGTLAGLSNFNGTIITANTSSNPIPAGKDWGSLSWLIYNASTGGQTVVGGTSTHLSIQNSSGTQTVSGDLTIYQRFIIASGATLSMGTYILSGPISSIEISGTLTTANTSATPIPTGRTWSGTINYNAASGGQTIVDGTYNNLTVGNTSGSQSPTNNLTVNGTLTTTAGGTLDMGTRNLTGTLATITNNGTILTASTSGSALPDGRTWGGTVEYNATAGAQTVADGTYNNLTLSNTSGTQTAHDNFAVNGTLTTSVGGTFDLGTKILSGTITTINHNGTIRTSNTTAAPLTSGKTWGGSGTVLYDVTTGGQTVVDGTYNNLTSGNSSNTNTASGNLVVNGALTTSTGGTLSMGTNTLSGTLATITNNGTISTGNTSIAPLPLGKTWGGTVSYTSFNGGQRIVGGTYNNLFQTNTSGTNNTSGINDVTGDLVVNGTLSISAGGTLNIQANTLSGSLTGIVNDGTFMISSISLNPIPSGKTWGGTVVYWANLGNQKIVSGTYNNLSQTCSSWGNDATGNLVVNGTLSISAGGILNMLAYTLSGSLTGIVNDGTFMISSTLNNPMPSGKTWGGTVHYWANNGGQKIMPGTYNNFINGNTFGTNTAVGDIAINGTLTTATGGTLDMGTNMLSGTLSSITNNGTITTSNTSSIPLSPEKIWGGTGTIQYLVTTGGQTIASGTYNNLQLGNTSGSNTAIGNIAVNGTLTTQTGGVLEMGTSVLSGILNTITNNGKIRTANTSVSSLTAGKTWNGTVEYYAASGTQTIANGVYNNLLMSNTSGTQTLNGTTTIGSALTLSGGKLALGSNTLNINGTLNGHSATSSFVANGSSNMVIGGSGSLGSSLFFDQTTPGTTNRLNNLTYNRASQIVTLGNALQVVGVVTPTAGTLATNDLLTLTSNATATGRIAAGSGAYITGTVAAERYIPSVARRFRFMASPVSGSTLADWKNEIYMTGAGGSANGFDSTSTNAPSVYYYNESLPGDNNTNGWVAAPNSNMALTPGKGFRVFIRGDRSDPTVLNGTTGTQATVTMNAIGPVNTGNISMPVTYTNSGNSSYDGWSFVGNPYPSPIDWDAFHDAGRTGSAYDYSGTDYAHLDAVIYIYDPAVNGYTSFNAFSGAHTGSMTNGVIPSGGAFWVKAAAASPAMTMKEIYKTDTASTGAVFKTSPEQKQFIIKLLSATDEKLHDEAAIKYVNEATNGFDAYDIRKLFGADVNISSIGNDASLLSANYKPFDGKSDSILLSIGMTKSGSYKLEFNDPSILVKGLEVYLIDLYTHQVVTITDGLSYPFVVDVNNAQTKGSNRFMIVVGGSKPVETSVDEILSNKGLSVYPALTNGEITISNHLSSDESVTVIVTNAAGVEVNRMNNVKWNNEKIVLDLSENKSGTYFISIQSASTQAVLKCIKY